MSSVWSTNTFTNIFAIFHSIWHVNGLDLYLQQDFWAEQIKIYKEAAENVWIYPGPVISRVVVVLLSAFAE